MAPTRHTFFLLSYMPWLWPGHYCQWPKVLLLPLCVSLLPLPLSTVSPSMRVPSAYGQGMARIGDAYNPFAIGIAKYVKNKTMKICWIHFLRSTWEKMTKVLLWKQNEDWKQHNLEKKSNRENFGDSDQKLSVAAYDFPVSLWPFAPQTNFSAQALAWIVKEQESPKEVRLTETPFINIAEITQKLQMSCVKYIPGDLSVLIS